MRDSTKKTLYCSLDIETSDFDATNGEILELGMVFFELGKKGLNVLSEWQSTFKPSKEVPARILALTGITNEELETSPLFRDKFDEIQDLVKDAVIVGHNIVFDIKFMESFGVKFSGNKIDTLDLAQMILPTNQSYNLEALMNLLQVSHKDAHRALADAKAAMVVVEKLLSFYSSFPDSLKEDLVKLFPKTEYRYINEILSAEFKEQSIALKSKDVEVASSKEISELLKDSNKIITFPLGFDHHSYIYGAVQKTKQKVLLIVPNKQTVYQLWKQKVAYPIFQNKDVFNNECFEKWLDADLSSEQRYFFSKILVWKNTNWQSQVLTDLNFSFFGNQFKNLINFDEDQKMVWELKTNEKVVVADYHDFISLNLAEVFSDRKLIILDLNNFESALTFISSKKVSWNDFIYSTKQIYDPLTNNGKKEFKELAAEALSQIDLFFGLASMHWKKIDAGASQLLVSEKIREKEHYNQIEKAAENFCAKMEEYNQKFNSERLKDGIASLRLFFQKDETQIKWIEISEGRLLFATSPLNLEGLSVKKLSPFKNILFTASLGSDALIKYFINRINLKDFGVVGVGQQELRKKFEVIIPNSLYDTSKILALLDKVEVPAALLLPNSSTLKTFYEANFKDLGTKFKVAAQSYSGGTNKLLDNFSINDNGLLLATDNFILKQAHRKVSVKTLIMSRIPFEHFNHPLFAAQAEKYPNQFIDFNVPRALYNFHSIIKFFYSSNLEKIYILDQKIHKEYGKFFIDYLKSLPFVEIKYEK